jgi:hypothetical protein
MPLTQLETDLRQLARNRIANGQLPNAVPERMWGGKSSGHSCSLCDRPIRELELELEEQVDGKVQTFHFHVLCQSLWQLECVHEHHLKNRPMSKAEGQTKAPPEGRGSIKSVFIG